MPVSRPRNRGCDRIAFRASRNRRKLSLRKQRLVVRIALIQGCSFYDAKQIYLGGFKRRPGLRAKIQGLIGL
jgi:hypothetical protein